MFCSTNSIILFHIQLSVITFLNHKRQWKWKQNYGQLCNSKTLNERLTQKGYKDHLNRKRDTTRSFKDHYAKGNQTESQNWCMICMWMRYLGLYTEKATQAWLPFSKKKYCLGQSNRHYIQWMKNICNYKRKHQLLGMLSQAD